MEFGKILSNAQTMESLTDLQALTSASKRKMAMLSLKVRDQKGADIKQRSIHDKSMEHSRQDKAVLTGNSLTWGLLNESLSSSQFLRYLMEVAACRSHSLSTGIVLGLGSS